MKKFLTAFCGAALLCAVLSGCFSSPEAQAASPAAGMDLDAAIKEGAAQLEANIPEGTKIALVSVASSSAQLSEYVISRLESALVGGKKLVVVDRANLDQVRAEQGFQMSGEVDDESAKKIGGLLGAGAIVTGAFTNLGDVYDMTLKAIEMETATVAVSYPAEIAKSARIETLLASGGGAAAASSGGAKPAGGQAAAAEPAGLKDGTYTFYPRLRPYSGADFDPDVYLYKITVRGEYMNIYLTGNAEGSTDRGPIGGWRAYDSDTIEHIVLQSLDNPALSYSPEPTGTYRGKAASGDSSGPEGIWYTFKRVKGTRFSLTKRRYQPPSTFEEIILGEPDAQ